MHNYRSVKLSPLLIKSVAFKECEISKLMQLISLWSIEQEDLDEKRNNTSSFLQGVASLNENLTQSNTKYY
jgi:FtsZ-binding cell division protein ZapB